MSDRREQILDRLFQCLQSVPGVTTVARNRGELPEDTRPAITMLDGDEDADLAAIPQGHMAMAPNLVIMRPEIYAVLNQREPKNEGVGQDLNNLRKEILRATINDPQLKTLVGSNGLIIYEGCTTDLASGRSMQGQIQVRVAFRYVLKPSDLFA